MEIHQMFKQRELPSDFSKYSKFYLSTTENIRGYLSLLDLNDKDILTVCGSGDQALSCIASGAKKVTCFDSNYLVKFILFLKQAMIITLSKEEYLSFFDKASDKYFNIDIYNYLKNTLDSETREFFDYVYKNYSIQEFSRLLFINSDIDRSGKYVNFHNDEAYIKLSNRLKNIEIDFINVNIFELLGKIDNSYDYMIFSNIFDYVVTTDGDLENFLDYMNRLAAYLNINGKIIMAYLYEYFNNNPVYSVLNIPKYDNELKNNPKYSIEKINGFIDGYENNLDGILFLHK